MAKYSERLEARKLRASGEGIKTIAHKLLVSSSTVSVWCRDIKLSQEQLRELERRSRDPNYGRRLENSLKQQRLRIEKTENLLADGIKEVGKLNKRELFVAGVALYWAEGFKKDNLVGFCNSDSGMIKLFLRWLRLCFSYKNEDFRLRVGANEDFKDSIEFIEDYWAKETGIPRTQFQRPFFQKVKWKKHYDDPENYHGVLRIRVKKSTDFLRKIKGYLEGLRLNGIGHGGNV